MTNNTLINAPMSGLSLTVQEKSCFQIFGILLIFEQYFKEVVSTIIMEFLNEDVKGSFCCYV